MFDLSRQRSRRQRRLRRAALATAAILAPAAALLPAVPAHAYIGVDVFDPSLIAPVYPGTSTPAPEWKVVGGGKTKAQRATASIVQIAPRWTMQSFHDGLMPGDTFITSSGTEVEVLDTWVSNQKPIAEGDGTASDWRYPGKADLTVSYLSKAVPRPPGEFPLLLRDKVGPDIDSVLPGYVLWAGLGPDETIRTPKVGWTRPNGLNVPGGARVTASGGDSGSGGLWYPSPGARAVASSTATFATDGAIAFGRDTMFGTRLGAGTQSFATVADWMQAAFDEHPPQPGDPSTAVPEWTTFEQLGIDFRTLKPPAPRNVRIKEATATTLTVAWDHPSETRVLRDGYRVTLSPLPVGVDPEVVPPLVDADKTSKVFTGLTPGTRYTATVKAVNGNGESPRAGRQGTSQAVAEIAKTDPSDASITEADSASTEVFGVSTPQVTLETSWRIADERVDYCLRATWPEATTDSGRSLTRYEVRLDSQDLSPSYIPGATQTFERCGLDPERIFQLSVRAWSGLVHGSWNFAFGQTPAGGPLGTPIVGPDLHRPTISRVVRSGRVRYCATLSWTASPAVDGYPVVGYTLAGFGSNTEFRESVPASEREVEICDLDRFKNYVFSLAARYGSEDTQSVSDSVWFNTPTGPVAGTALPVVDDFHVITTTRNTAGRVDLCVEATWNPAAQLPLMPALSYSLAIFGMDGTNKHEDWGAATTKTSHRWCDLRAGTRYTVGIAALFESDGEGPQPVSRVAAVTTPTGATSGAVWPVPTGLATSQATVGGERCVTAKWLAPAAISGYPVRNARLTVYSSDLSYVGLVSDIDPAVHEATLCGLPAATTLTVKVTANYTSNAATSVSEAIVTAG